MHIHTPKLLDLRMLSRFGFFRTMGWAFIASVGIVAATAGLARATLNLRGALTDKPDLAFYVLRPEEEISDVTLLRENEEKQERDYLVETKDGPKLSRLRKIDGEWRIVLEESLHR